MAYAYDNGRKTRSASIVELTGEQCDTIAQLLHTMIYFINKEMVERKEDPRGTSDLEAMYKRNIKARDEIYRAIANRKDNNY